MSRFAFYTDIHLSGQTPRHRVDDYPQTLLKKLDEVYTRAEDSGCDFVIFGGDLFHTHRIYSYNVISAVMDVICDSKLKTYSVIGQHDLKGYNRNTFDTSTLAFVVRRCANFHIVWEPTEVEDCWLVPSHVWDDINEADIEACRSDRFNILIAHHLLTNKKQMFDVVNTTQWVKDMDAGCPYQLVLSGDLHDGYEPHEVEGTWFCNPGSLARRATSDAERHPQFAIIDVAGPNLPPVIDIQQLKCAKPGDEVFSHDVAELVRQREEFDAENLVEGMMDFEIEAVDIHDLIQTVGRSEGVSKTILDYLSTKNCEKIS
jgi:DNA repair exonuclease SbcCD nuclease subunit